MTVLLHRVTRIPLALAVIATAGVFVTSPAADAKSSPKPVEITGSGSWEIAALMTEWAKTTFNSPTPVQLNYLAKGDRDGRIQLSTGIVDFAISGRPLSKDDEEELAKRKLGVISAPISVAGSVFLISGPYPTGLRTITIDPDDPESATFAPYNGPLRMSHELLAQTVIRRTAPGGNWADPGFLAALDLPPGTELAVVPTPALSVARSDPGAVNWYLAEYSRKFAPKEWAAALAEAGAVADVRSESWPLVTANTRSGSQAVAQLIGSWRDPGSNSTPLGGTIGMVGISSALEQFALQIQKAEIYKADPTKDPPTPLWIPQMRNGAGEWVAASSESITTAAEAGAKAGVRAMYGLTENVPGAWPFWWTNDILMPTTGLTADQTTALASFVRWAVTAGQSATAVTGDGRLPAVWAQEALAAADKVVKSNCTGPDRKLVEAKDGGPMWPPGAPVPGDSALICVSTASGSPSSTNTTTTGTGSTPRVAGSGVDAIGTSGGSRSPFRRAATGIGAGVIGYDLPVDGNFVEEEYPEEGAEIAAAANPGVASAGPEAAAQPVAASMPLKDPDDGRGGLDRLATLLLGGLGFLLARSGLRRRGTVQ